MGDMRVLYQEVILDHGRRPRNFGADAGANRRAHGHNPLCGDELTLHLRVKDTVITDARFEGASCAISTAAASLMTEAVKGNTEEQAKQLTARYLEMITGSEGRSATSHDVARAELGKLAVLGGVRAFPARVKCATLAWHTLIAALDQHTTTEEDGAFRGAGDRPP